MTVFLLDLSKRQISAIGSLPDCLNLLMLDLAYNQLQVIAGIEVLVNLKHLNLSYNKLTQVDALKGCVALQKLELQGNSIKDMRTIEAIGPTLVNLRILYLQEFNQSGANLVCAVADYREKAYRAVVSLKALDGQRKNAPYFEFYEPDLGNEENLDYNVNEEWPEVKQSEMKGLF